MDNLEIYNKVRTVPKEALKEIAAGRLKGKSDINPMWRFKTLTDQFGICGFGWKYEITKQWIEEGGKGEKAAFVNINLFVKLNGEWSEAIPGTGGSSFLANEKNGLYTSDECFKMALTDAISVSCKALGFGADVYWSSDKSKYQLNVPQQPKQDIKPYETSQNPVKTDLEQRLTTVYMRCKNGLKWTSENFGVWLKDMKEARYITSTQGKTMTVKDVEYIEAQYNKLKDEKEKKSA